MPGNRMCVLNVMSKLKLKLWNVHVYMAASFSFPITWPSCQWPICPLQPLFLLPFLCIKHFLLSVCCLLPSLLSASMHSLTNITRLLLILTWNMTLTQWGIFLMKFSALVTQWHSGRVLDWEWRGCRFHSGLSTVGFSWTKTFVPH